MSRPRVRLGIPPHLADLELWGRDVCSEWWALVVWSVQVTPADGDHPVPVGCAAWVPGVQVEQPLQPVDYLEVRRMQLPAEPAEWPHPSTVPAHTGAGNTSASSTPPSRSHRPRPAGRGVPSKAPHTAEHGSKGASRVIRHPTAFGW